VLLSIKRSLRFLHSLNYCQLKLLHCGKFAPKVDFCLQCNPYGTIDLVQIRNVRWPLLWQDEVNLLLMKKVDCISGCVRRNSVLLYSPVMATTCRLNDRQQASFENMLVVVYTYSLFIMAPGSTNTTLVFPIRDTTNATVIGLHCLACSRSRISVFSEMCLFFVSTE